MFFNTRSGAQDLVGPSSDQENIVCRITAASGTVQETAKADDDRSSRRNEITLI